MANKCHFCTLGYRSGGRLLKLFFSLINDSGGVDVLLSDLMRCSGDFLVSSQYSQTTMKLV